jgi:hypothetical protein
MKPYGYKIKAGCDCKYCRMPNPKSKKSARLKAKNYLKKELKCLKD